jgi:hypothetical protein
LSAKLGSSDFRENILECEKLTHTTYDNDGTKEIIISTFVQPDSG